MRSLASTPRLWAVCRQPRACVANACTGECNESLEKSQQGPASCGRCDALLTRNTPVFLDALQVYEPQDWDFADGSFFLHMREAPAVDQRFEFEYTGGPSTRFAEPG